jgi:nucleotidyltransferase substrate binding protein (TIGR01987 family)
MAVSIDEFKKAVLRLEDALNQEKNEFIRDSVIQRFEFCVELAWKTSRKLMGTSTSAPKQVVREMAQNGLVDDVDIWLQAIDERNNSSHTYNESLAEQVYQFVEKFLPFLKSLVINLENL